MSNFKNWRKPGALEAFERATLERRLNKSQSTNKQIESVVIPSSLTMGVAYEDGGPITNKKKLAVKVVKMNGVQPKTPPPRTHVATTFVGVDPALRKGGFWLCIICRVDNTATFKTCKHLGEFVRILQDCEPAAVIVENSNLQKAVFDKKSGVGGAISVGKNQGVSQAAADIANQYSAIPSGISPKQKGAKVVNETVFQGIVRANNLTLTKYKAGDGIGQDQRDALMLALIAEQQYKLLLKTKYAAK